MSIFKLHLNSLNADENDGLFAGCKSDKIDVGTEIVSIAGTVTPPTVLVYDQIGGIGQIENKTVEARSTSNSNFEIYNSNGDALRVGIEVFSTTGIDISLHSGAVLTGTPVVTASYRNASGSVISLPVSITGDWTGGNIINLSHTEVLASDIGDYAITAEPNAELGKFIDYRVEGINTIDTVAVAEWIRSHLGTSTTREYTRFTDLMQAGVYSQEVQDVVIAPVAGDVTLIGFDAKPAKLTYNIFRGTSSETATTKRVYSTLSGLEELPAENIIKSETTGFLFNDKGKEVYDGEADQFTDVLIPPDNWLKTNLIIEGVNYTKYWLGFEYLTSAVSAWPMTLFTIKSQPIHGEGVVGIPQLTEQTTYDKISVSAENVGVGKFLVSNTRSGESVVVDISNTNTVNMETLFVDQLPADEYLFQTLYHEGLNTPSLLTIQIT